MLVPGGLTLLYPLNPLERLAESEQVVETCVCALMGIGFDKIGDLYNLLRKKSKMPDRTHLMQVGGATHARGKATRDKHAA